MTTIPGTFVDEATKRIRWERLLDQAPGRCYRAKVADGWLKAIVSQDPVEERGILKTLWHLSVSHSGENWKPGRLPTWDELKHAKFNLVREDVPMVLIFPSSGAVYVNEYPTCLHLWEGEKGIDK